MRQQIGLGEEERRVQIATDKQRFTQLNLCWSFRKEVTRVAPAVLHVHRHGAFTWVQVPKNKLGTFTFHRFMG